MMKILMKFMSLIKKDKIKRIYIGRCGIIVPTNAALQQGVNDIFNKKIIIYSRIEVKGNRIIYGKVLEERPYTEEEVKNLIKIKRIPIVQKRISNKYEFEEGKPFGEFEEN